MGYRRHAVADLARKQSDRGGEEAELLQVEDASLLEPVPEHSYRMLIVDDDELVLGACARTLRADTRIIDTAGSAAQALELVGQHEYAVVLTDYRMAGLDGIELCERVRLRSPDTVCVLVTGHADMQVALSAINRAGCSAS